MLCTMTIRSIESFGKAELEGCFYRAAVLEKSFSTFRICVTFLIYRNRVLGFLSYLSVAVFWRLCRLPIKSPVYKIGVVDVVFLPSSSAASKTENP